MKGAERGIRTERGKLTAKFRKDISSYCEKSTNFE